MSIKMFNIVALSDDAVVINGAGGSSGPTAKAGRRKGRGAKAKKAKKRGRVPVSRKKAKKAKRRGR